MTFWTRLKRLWGDDRWAYVEEPMIEEIVSDLCEDVENLEVDVADLATLREELSRVEGRLVEVVRVEVARQLAQATRLRSIRASDSQLFGEDT